MLRLSKKADYALISLAYLAEHPDHVVSAREIAETCGLPLPLLMNILKVLHQRGILRSTRGATGGYRIASDLSQVSLYDLNELVERVENGSDVEPTRRLAQHGPAQALQYRLIRFMKDVSLADLVLPGRRIDVPLERVGVLKTSKSETTKSEQSRQSVLAAVK